MDLGFPTRFCCDLISVEMFLKPGLDTLRFPMFLKILPFCSFTYHQFTQVTSSKGISWHQLLRWNLLEEEARNILTESQT